MKSSMDDLRIFGGPPLFATPVHVGHPNLLRKDSLERRLSSVLASGQLTNHGPQVRQLEERLAEILGVRNAVAVCNATTGLQILARALNLRGEVIMPSFTFIATAHAMEWIGLVPVFADIDPTTHTLSPGSVRQCLTQRTSAILGVHVWGNLCETEALQAIADEFGIPLIFDACHAFGCSKHGRFAGQFGQAEVFSLHATKLVHSLEGGVITTNDDAIASRCRRLRNFGITGLTEVSDIGINGKMHELSAAAGLHSLEDLPEIMSVNARNRQLWQSEVVNVPGVSLQPVPVGQASNDQYVVCRIDEAQFGLTRDQLVTILRAEGLFARSYFVPGCHRSFPYRDVPGARPELPVTELILNDVLQLPTGLSIGPSTIAQTGELLRFVQNNARAILEEMLTRPILGHHDSDPVFFGIPQQTLADVPGRHPAHSKMVPEPHATVSHGVTSRMKLDQEPETLR